MVASAKPSPMVGCAWIVPAISSPRTHFDCLSESRRQFGDTRADRLNSQNEMIVGARDDTDHAVVAFHRHGAAVGLERENADLDFMPGLARLVGRQAHRHDFRVGEADRGIARLSQTCFPPATISATISPCAMARCASMGSPVTSPIA